MVFFQVFSIDGDQPTEEKAAEVVRLADLAIAAERQRLQQLQQEEAEAAADSKEVSDLERQWLIPLPWLEETDLSFFRF